MPALIANVIAHIRTDQRGATAVEYAIVGSAIAAVIVVAVTALGLETLGLFNAVEEFFFGNGA